MPLKSASLKTMKRGRHPDGRYGLYFNVIGNSRTWVQRLTIDGKRRNFGLGPWPVVSLSEARDIAFDNVRKRHRGIDPIADRERAAAMPTFAQAADSCIALRAGGWKAGSRNEANWRSSLAHAAPLANRAVDAIASDDVVGIVTALLRAGKAPTARSVRQRIRHVFDWCIAQGHRTDNPANDAIDALLPSSGHKTKHRESVAVADVAQVVAKIETTAHASWLGAGMALRFLVLTAARTSEAIGARWSEIDLDYATWIIPAARMKGGEAHRVPLAEAAVAVLAKARARWGSTGLVFRSARGTQIDEAALRRLLRHTGTEATVHGFRGTFKSWCMESGVARELAELSLAHTYMGDAEASYVRTDLLDRRRPVMARWGRFVTGAEAPTAAGVRGAV